MQLAAAAPARPVRDVPYTTLPCLWRNTVTRMLAKKLEENSQQHLFVTRGHNGTDWKDQLEDLPKLEPSRKPVKLSQILTCLRGLAWECLKSKSLEFHWTTMSKLAQKLDSQGGSLIKWLMIYYPCSLCEGKSPHQDTLFLNLGEVFSYLFDKVELCITPPFSLHVKSENTIWLFVECLF